VTVSVATLQVFCIHKSQWCIYSIQCWPVISVESSTTAGWGIKARTDWVQG